jgi:hypothetical protein
MPPQARVVLHGCAEFEAADVELRGDLTFDVPDGHRMTVARCDASPLGFHARLEPLTPAAPSEAREEGEGEQGGRYEPTWQWRYAMARDGGIVLSCEEGSAAAAAAVAGAAAHSC